MYSFLKAKLTEQNVHITTPAFTIWDTTTITNAEQSTLASIQFPVVCKTIAACGKQFAHNMAIVFDAQELHKLVHNSSNVALPIPLPLVAQEFVNHDGILYKAYVIGDHTFVQYRPSIRNFEANGIRLYSYYSAL